MTVSSSMYPNLFDIDEARAARDEAIGRVAANANEEWMRVALLSVSWIAMTQETFTADDVWSVLAERSETTHEPRALGAVMKRGQKIGYSEPTDEWVQSSRPDCHGRPIRVWRSLLFGPNRGDLTVVGSGR